MEQINDIRLAKKALREKIKAERLSLDAQYKKTADSKIKNKVLNLWSLREAETVLTYVSTDIEVDTKALIYELFKMKKKIAVPKCLNNKGDMKFFYINSFDDLEPGFFGVLEPKEHCKEFDYAQKSICIVPAFMFDKNGYRLGYGKGYYDRFLSGYNGTAVGICYDTDITDNLLHGKFDRTVSTVITDKRIFNINFSPEK